MFILPRLQMHGLFLQQLPVLSPAVSNLNTPVFELTEQPGGIVEDPDFSFAVMVMSNSTAASAHSEYEVIGLQVAPPAIAAASTTS